MVEIIIGLVGCALVLAFIAKSFESESSYLYKFIFVVAALLMLISANQTIGLYANISNPSISGNLTSLINNSSGLLLDYILLIFISLTMLFFLIKILTDIIGRIGRRKHKSPIKPGGV